METQKAEDTEGQRHRERKEKEHGNKLVFCFQAGTYDSLCAVLLPEVVILLLADLLDHVQRLAHQFLFDHLQQLVLLQRLTRHVKGQIITVHLQQHARGHVTTAVHP